MSSGHVARIQELLSTQNKAHTAAVRSNQADVVNRPVQVRTDYSDKKMDKE